MGQDKQAVRAPSFYEVTTTRGERFHIRALGKEDARALFHDCRIGFADDVRESIDGAR